MLFKIVYGHDDHALDIIESLHNENCPDQPSIISKPMMEISKAMYAASLGEHAASDAQIKKAPCRNLSPPTQQEMEDWLNNYMGTRRKNETTHGNHFNDESPKMIDLFKKLHTYSLPFNIKVEYLMKTGCIKVICAMKRIYGEKEGVQLLYLLAKYGFNGSPNQYEDKEHIDFWKSNDLDKVFIGLSDFPEGIFPIAENKPLVRFKRGITRSQYRILQERTGGCVSANAIIEVFDCIDKKSDSEYQQVIFHEVAHIIRKEYGLDSSSPWLNFAEWEETTVPNGKDGFNTNYKYNKAECMVSQFGETNPHEDFAESIVAYRYNPKPMKDSCPNKYNYIKDIIFDGIEYLDESGCKDKELSKKRFPKLNSWLRSIKFRL